MKLGKFTRPKYEILGKIFINGYLDLYVDSEIFQIQVIDPIKRDLYARLSFFNRPNKIR